MHFKNMYISLTACFKDGKEIQGNDCYRSKHGKKKAIILAGTLMNDKIS